MPAYRYEALDAAGKSHSGLLEADYIVVEMARLMLGENWLPDYVARANTAGIGRAAATVRIAEGSWFEALPSELRGQLHLVALGHDAQLVVGRQCCKSVRHVGTAHALGTGRALRQAIEPGQVGLAQRGTAGADARGHGGDARFHGAPQVT